MTFDQASFVPANWRLEGELAGYGGGWSDLGRDFRQAAGLQIGYGIRGNWPTDLVAAAGTMVFSLDNSHANSQGVVGLYAIGGPAAHSGFVYGMRVRFVLDGVVRFLGKLDSAPPSPGIYGPRDVRCRATDFMSELGRKPVRGISTQTGIKAGAVLTALLDAMDVQPAARSIGEGSDTYAYAFDQAQGPMRDEVQAVTQSEMGRAYDLGGTFTFEPRHVRTNPTVAFTLYKSKYIDFDPGNSYERSNVITRAENTVHPRDVGAAAVTLYTHQDKTFIGPGMSVDIVAKYVDPDQKAAAIGGASVAVASFTANTRDDGTGTNMTASLTVAANPAMGGREAPLRLMNGHATQWLYVTSLILTGIPVRDLEPVTSVSVADAAALQQYGENVVSIDMKYQGSATFGQAVADGIRTIMGTPRLWSGKFRFCANTNDFLMSLAVTANISTCFEFYEDITGKSTWFINAVDLEIDSNGLLWVTWTCEPADMTHYWMPGVDVLGETTIPAPF